MTQNLHCYASGFDAYSSCYRTSRKRQELPCDFGSQTWCTIPGSAYPWHAVRRFVHENQGLMKRMYGDERHISVLRAELETNDIEYYHDAVEGARRRYSKEMDGSKDFVKSFVNNDGRKLRTHPKILEKKKSLEKLQKSIDEKSNNVLFQNNVKNSEEDFKTLSLNNYSNKSFIKTTTTSRTTTAEATTKQEILTSTATNSTTQEPNVTSAPPTLTVVELTTETTSKTEGLNVTRTTALPNDTQIEEETDYKTETEETLTTTGAEGLTTTDEIDFDEDETPNDQEEGYDEEVEIEEQEVVEEPSSQQPPPLIRLKGINACPVKEEVVAPFWANNTRGEVLALLNLYPFEQYVHWEKCTYEHKQMFCREGCRCEQQYRLHRLLAYDPNNECRGIFSDWFRFPSCCVCKCYDLPMEFRLTSRSPRFKTSELYKNSFDRFSHLKKP